MSIVRMELDRSGVLDYVKQGKEAVKRVREAMKAVVNDGRKTARGLLGSKFHRRTGRLAKQTRGIRTQVTVRTHTVSGSVGPLPNLSNIFEKGATIPARTIAPKQRQALRFIGKGGGEAFVRGAVLVSGFHLTARPTKQPTMTRMIVTGTAEMDKVIEEIARA